MIKDFKKWLETPCPQIEIRYADEENKKGEYIPIGIIEQNLDEFDNWNTENFFFIMQRVDKSWVASGSVQLIVTFGDKTIKRNGAATFPVFTKSANDDFEATALSLAISNAAKKLGKRFGRHLNGRLEKGDTAPVIDLQEQRKLDLAIDAINECESEVEIKNLFDNIYPQYQKNREFIISISNRKAILKIKEAKNEQQ